MARTSRHLPAVTVCAISTLPEGLRLLRPDEGLPALPEFGILMLKGRTAAQPVTDALAEHIEASFRADRLHHAFAA